MGWGKNQEGLTFKKLIWSIWQNYKGQIHWKFLSLSKSQGCCVIHVGQVFEDSIQPEVINLLNSRPHTTEIILILMINLSKNSAIIFI